MNTWLADFERHLQEEQGLSANSVRAYAGDVRCFAAWMASRYSRPFTPEQLTAVDVQAWKKALMAQKAAPAGINRRVASLRAFAKWRLADIRVEFVPLPQPAPRWLPRTEMHRLLAEYERAVRSESGRPGRQAVALRNRAIAMLQAGAGLRLGEALALDVEDITIGDRSGMARVRYSKGSKSRAVPLNIETRRALTDWIGVRGEAAGPLFNSQKGGRLTERPVQTYFQEMVRRANIEGEYTPHSLRHCFVRRMIEAGVELKAVQALAGHSRLEMTLRYGLPGEEAYQEAVEHVFA
jgi:site-specific recombinase XerD